MRQQVAQLEAALGASQNREDSIRQALSDSFGAVVATQQDSISRIRSDLTAAQKQVATSTSPPKSTVTKKKYTHEEILTYYQKKYRELPKDLSPYERRVALAELRENTARHFSIPISRLNDLRKEHKLDY